MIAHTQGPWRYEEGRAGLHPFVQRGDQGGFTVKALCGMDRANADARLIAAAPEMLAALEEAESVLRRAGCEITADMAKAVIAKARGAA